MALRRASTDKRADDGADAPSAGPKVGESVEECVALGQALVEAGHLTGEMLAPALADGAGDLWEFGQILLTKYGIGRVEYAAALGKAVGLPVAATRASDVNKDLAGEVDEKVARRFKFVPVASDGGRVTVWGADCSPKKRADAEAAAGKKFEWFATDPKTVTSFMEQMWRSDA